jgi:DNA-binding GntR family transcriptional regulator
MLFRRRSLAPHPTLDEHRDIVKRIVANDAAGAAEAIRRHVENARQRILAAYAP